MHLLESEFLNTRISFDLRHRPNLTLSEQRLNSRTVTQLRYVHVSVLQAAAGLNGWAVIKEEKARAIRRLSVRAQGVGVGLYEFLQ